MADIEKKVKVTITGDSQDLQKALKSGEKATEKLADTTEKEVKKTNRSLSSIGASAKSIAVGIGAVITAIAGVAATGLKAFIEQEKVMKITKQTIQSTGDAAGLAAKEVFKMASELQKVTLFGDEAIIAGQNLLLTFKNIGKDVFPQVTETMLNMSQAMGTDLKSSAIQLGKALNDPKEGISALSRVGITFNEQQKEQIKNMQAAGDLAGAQAIILKELESQFGGVARAAASGTGVYQQFSNVLGDIMEVGGEVVDRFIQPIVRDLKGLAERFIDSGAAATTFEIAVGAIMIPLRALGFAIDWAVIKPIGLLGDALVYVSNLIGVDLSNSLNSMKAFFISFGGTATKIPLTIQDAWLALKETAYQVIADTSDYFNKSIAAMQDAANKIPFLQGTFGRGGSEALSGITQGAQGEVSAIQGQRQGLQNQMAGIDAATDRAISDAIFPTNEAGTAFDPNVTPTDAGLEVLAEAEQKKIDKLAEMRAQEKEDALKAEEDFQNSMHQTIAGAAIANLNLDKNTRKQQQEVASQFHNNMLALANSSNKQLAAVGKAYAIADAIVNTYKAANLAMATLPPPFGQVAAAAAIAAGLANVKAIKSTNPQTSALQGTTSGLALGSVPPRDAGMNNASIAQNGESGYYQNKVKVEFVGDAARLLQAVNKEGSAAGFI